MSGRFQVLAPDPAAQRNIITSGRGARLDSAPALAYSTTVPETPALQPEIIVRSIA